MAVVVANPRGYTNEIMIDEQRKLNDFLKSKCVNIQSLYFHPRYYNFLLNFNKMWQNSCEMLCLLFHLFSLHTRSSKDSTFIHIDGDKYIYEQLSGFKFRISPDSFFQINTLAAEVLYDELFKLCSFQKTSTLLDLCSGTGEIFCLCKFFLCILRKMTAIYLKVLLVY